MSRLFLLLIETCSSTIFVKALLKRSLVQYKQQVGEFVTKVVRSHNQLSHSINYVEIANTVRRQTNINISLGTVRRYGQKHGVKSKKAVKRTYREIADTSCDIIVKLCQKSQRVSNDKIIFLDETHIKTSEVPRTTLVAPGEKPYAVVTDSSSYAARYYMIAAVIGNQVLPPIIFTPQDRAARNARGINVDMLADFIENILCPSINELHNCPTYLILDRSSIHNVSKIEQALRNGGCTGLREVLILLTQAAKCVSSLDNMLFHEWKERIRKHSLLTEDTLVPVVIDEWYNTKEESIKHYYDHCAITYRQDVYKDCPFPLKRRH